jgi:hypothetical protein
MPNGEYKSVNIPTLSVSKKYKKKRARQRAATKKGAKRVKST